MRDKDKVDQMIKDLNEKMMTVSGYTFEIQTPVTINSQDGLITMRIVATEGEETLTQKDLRTWAETQSLDMESLSNITIRGRTFNAIGYKRKATKNNIIIKDVIDGKEFVTSSDTIKRILSKGNTLRMVDSSLI